MTHEEWRDILGFEGLYQVSSMGRVRSVDRIVVKSNGVIQKVSGRLLKPHGSKTTHHYMQVILSKCNKRYAAPVHRLVATTFLECPNGCNVVDHINGDIFDNRSENLRWCTQQNNLQYCRERGVARFPHFHDWSEDTKRKYLKKVRKPIVRSDGKRYECTSDAAKDLGVTYAAISHVLRGTTKACKGFSFSYAES